MLNKNARLCRFALRRTIITVLLSLITMIGQAQEAIWNDVVMGYANASVIKVNRVAMYADRTDVSLHINFRKGQQIGFIQGTALKADGKEFKVTGATVIKLDEPYTMTADTLSLTLSFEPLPAATRKFDFTSPDGLKLLNIRSTDYLPDGIADTYWRDNATGDWLIGFAEKHVIYNNKVWDIATQTGKKNAYTLTLDDGTTVKVGKMKNGRRTIAIGNAKPVACSPIIGAALPDYPLKDMRTGFVDNGYKQTDSVTVIGWLKDMPEQTWKKGKEFEVHVNNIFTDEQESTYAMMDSLGRFTMKMPLLNTSQVFLDWGRTTQSTVLEPGKTYFFLSDFMTGQKLWMGSDVRVQNELLAHPHSWVSADIDRNRRDLDPMTYLAQADSVRQKQMSELEQLTTSNANLIPDLRSPTRSLSQRYHDYVAGYYQNIQGESMMQAHFHFPNYEIPQEYMDYLDRECWQKAVKPYTLYRDFSMFMRDYLGEVTRKRVWTVNWNLYDYNDALASNDEELSLLNRWKNWLIDANAKVGAATTQEEKQKLAEKLNADNADMITEVDKILNGPKGQKVRRGIDLVIRMKQDFFALDSLGADQDIKDFYLTQLAYRTIDHTHASLAPMVIDTLKALTTNPYSLEIVEKKNDHYLAIENREFDKLVIKSSDNLKDISEGEALLRKIIEPYKGKFVLLDIWGTWCGPCKEALSHSTEEYARLKDYDIEFLYLANDSPQTSWENVIKEYNVSGPNVAHYNLPADQQSAIEHHLNVHSFPTYKLFDRNGNLLDLKVDARDLEGLAGLLEQMK